MSGAGGGAGGGNGGGEQYNTRSPAVKRILREATELRESTYEYYAQPLEDNIFEWHFTVRGAEDTDFSDGLYHGRIVLPNDYPMKPPSIILLTPNGRFEVNKKICLSISGYHPETWQPCWSIRTVLLAIIAFMPTKSDGAIGSLEYTAPERKTLAKKSHRWKCSTCGQIKQHLKSEKAQKPAGHALGGAQNGAQNREDAEFQDFMSKVMFQSEKPTATTTSENISPNSQPIDHVRVQSDSTNDRTDLEPESSSSISAAEPVETPNQTEEPTTAESVIIKQPSSSSAVLETPILNASEVNQEQANLNSNSTTGPNQEEVVQSTPSPPLVTRNRSTLNQVSNGDTFLHGPIANALLLAIFVVIMAILIRRVYPYFS